MPSPASKPYNPRRRIHAPPRLSRSESKQARRLVEGLRELWSCDDPKDRQDRAMFDSSDFR